MSGCVRLAQIRSVQTKFGQGVSGSVILRWIMLRCVRSSQLGYNALIYEKYIAILSVELAESCLMASLASSFLYSERWIRIAAIYVELTVPCLMAPRGTSFQRTSSDLQRRVAWHLFIRNLALSSEQYASRRSALGCRSHVRHPNVRLSFALLRVEAVVTFVKTTGVDFPAPYHMASRGCSTLHSESCVYVGKTGVVTHGVDLPTSLRMASRRLYSLCSEFCVDVKTIGFKTHCDGLPALGLYRMA